MSLEELGAVEIGDVDWGSLFSAAGELTQQGVAAVQQQQASDAAGVAAIKAQQEAIVADQNLALALANDAVLNTPASHDALAAAQSLDAAAVAALTTPAQQTARVNAARTNLATAMSSLQTEKDKSKVAFRQADVHAWQVLFDAAQAGTAPSGVPVSATAAAVTAPVPSGGWTTTEKLAAGGGIAAAVVILFAVLRKLIGA